MSDPRDSGRASEAACPTVVVKVGGSLFDLPDLAARLERWMERAGDDRFVLVPGGGATADIIRTWDRHHRLGEEKAHWLALRALWLNAHFLAGVFPRSRVIRHVGDRQEVHEAGLIPIVDMYHFALEDERHEGHLPHSWQVTSDSLAARVAHRLQAQQLILLKSVTVGLEIDWPAAARRGLVDAFFPEMARRTSLPIRAVNLRLEA